MTSYTRNTHLTGRIAISGSTWFLNLNRTQVIVTVAEHANDRYLVFSSSAYFERFGTTSHYMYTVLNRHPDACNVAVW
jgi:hypothetical protein